MDNYYEEIKEIQKLAWEGDDLMDQDALFEMQDKLAKLTLKIAINEKKTADLVKTFPWLYKRREK